MEVRYLQKDEKFGDDLNSEIIEIKYHGLSIGIEAVIKADNVKAAIVKFCAALSQETKNCIITININNLQDYLLDLSEKTGHSRRNNYERFGYACSVESVDDIYYINVNLKYHKNKFTYSLREALEKKGEI